jgi:hypothetical protein
MIHPMATHNLSNGKASNETLERLFGVKRQMGLKSCALDLQA